jgi:hypothetical protein
VLPSPLQWGSFSALPECLGGPRRGRCGEVQDREYVRIKQVNCRCPKNTKYGDVSWKQGQNGPPCYSKKTWAGSKEDRGGGALPAGSPQT